MTQPSNNSSSTLCISSTGLAATLPLAKQAKYPGQHLQWTDDFRVELPIRVGQEGAASLPPKTMLDLWR